MDFIEQLFGLSPDNGDGTTELIWLAATIGIAALFVARRYAKRRASRQDQT